MNLKLRTKTALFTTLAVSALLLAGCGGSGSAHLGGGGGTEEGTGTVDLNVTNAVGSNADASAFHSTRVTGTEHTSGIGTQLNFTTTSGTGLPTRSFVATMIGASAPAVGTSYVIGGSNPNTLVYNEVVSTTEVHGWVASGGNMRVTAIDGNKITLAVEAAMVAGDTGGGTGTFNVNGTVVIDAVNNL